MKDTIIKYLISTALSFATGFFGYMLMALETGETFSDLSWRAVLLGAAYAGVRLVIKTIVEFLPKLVSLLSKK